MEPRSWKYIKKNNNYFKKIAVLMGIIMTYSVFCIFLKSLPGSYAWFNASANSKGQIVNASTSDLIKVVPENIIYEEDGKVKTLLSIKNISKIKIPLSVELVLNNQVFDTTSITLYQNDTFSTGWEEIKEIPLGTKDIQFRIIGFNGYIYEVISSKLDQEKLKMTMISNDNHQMKSGEKNFENSPSQKSTTTRGEGN